MTVFELECFFSLNEFSSFQHRFPIRYQSFFIRLSYILLIGVSSVFQSIHTNICKSMRILSIVQMKHIKTGRITVNWIDLKRRKMNYFSLFATDCSMKSFTLNQRWPNVRGLNRLLVLDQSDSSNWDWCCSRDSSCLACTGSASNRLNVPNQFPVACVSSLLWAKRKLVHIFVVVKNKFNYLSNEHQSSAA